MTQVVAMAPALQKSKEQHEFEFLGPHGTIFVTLLVPFVCYFLFFSCHSVGCLELLPRINFPALPNDVTLFSTEAFGVFLGWIFTIFALHALLPGRKVQGVQLANNTHLTYKLNGLYVAGVLLPSVLYLSFRKELLPLSWVYDNFVALLSASLTFSTCFSICLYATSFLPKRLLAKGGSTGYVFYDFFMGRELNPRIGSIDLKEVCELYPGLIGWVVIDLAMAHKQHQQLGYVSLPLALVCIFHTIYVLDSLWFERAILTTMDITTDGFGFMLAFGDLTWVPFTYSLQARYLVDYYEELSPAFLTAVVLLNIVGYTTFRGSNSQKDQFRRDPSHPSVRHLKTLKTERGRLLMISGWWGIARHINYFGDWLLGLSWCLPCGFKHLVPYFYAIYFAVLLVHRDLRDEHSCQKKYGKDWDKYCSHVKYRIVPFIY